MTKITVGVGVGLLCAGLGGVRQSRGPAARNQISWVKDLATAQQRARTHHKLVLQFLMLGDLSDPHC